MQRILIANRGEIAVRIASSLQQMGLTAVAVYSDVDKNALHTLVCDEAYPLGGQTPLESYLRQELILEIAKKHQIDAIHPGYGFLSENAGFARKCQEAGIVFIGPTPEVIQSMGDKILAKTAMKAAGVPMVPSFDPPAQVSQEEYLKAAGEIGFPLLVKAAAGGGGKGMRLVSSADQLEEALQMAQGEAAKAFGDSRVFLERYVERPRHIEIQIFGDQHGNVVHLGERECSIQRRYQKIIEESPSPALTPELRSEMGEAACRGARALGYSNAGTVEFLLDDQGRFYFLEVNTRLQVEHPITELVYGYDLVKAQIAVARGEQLPFKQSEIQPRGWAMECRLYAENPDAGFLPCTGTLEVFRAPSGPWIRLDSGFKEGDEVSVFYDPMLAKLITYGSDREDARRRMVWALEHFVVLGVTNNLHFLARVLQQSEFVAGQTHTHFLQDYPLPALDSQVPPELVALAQAAQSRLQTDQGSSSGINAPQRTPWDSIGGWRSCQSQ